MIFDEPAHGEVLWGHGLIYLQLAELEIPVAIVCKIRNRSTENSLLSFHCRAGMLWIICSLEM